MHNWLVRWMIPFHHLASWIALLLGRWDHEKQNDPQHEPFAQWKSHLSFWPTAQSSMLSRKPVNELSVVVSGLKQLLLTLGIADCMFPGKPICIDVQDAGHQDYLVMIFSIAVVGLAGFGMLSALAHFILRLKTKPARKLAIPEFAKKSLRYRVSLEIRLTGHWQRKRGSEARIETGQGGKRGHTDYHVGWEWQVNGDVIIRQMKLSPNFPWWLLTLIPLQCYVPYTVPRGLIGFIIHELQRVQIK